MFCPGQSNTKSRSGVQSASIVLHLVHQLSLRYFFSIMNNMWSGNWRRMLEQNVQVLITCKINTAFSCCDFYESKIEQRILETIVAQKSIIGRKCKTTNAWALFCFLENRIILLFLVSQLQGSKIATCQPHLSDRVRCFEASRFSTTKIWYAYQRQNICESIDSPLRER